MLHKLKKAIAIVLSMVFIITSFADVPVVNAKGFLPLTKENILNLDKSELLNVMKDNGLILPEDYAIHSNMAEEFVYKYTRLIIEKKIEVEDKQFNYNQSNELLGNIYKVLYNSGLIINKSRQSYAAKSYSLKDSSPIGSWNSNFNNYNCYAYSIGRTTWLIPGDICRKKFSMTMSISTMADLVLSDLNEMGYWGYKTTKKPSSLTDKNFKVIAIRKDTGNEDFHFMRMYDSSLNSWAHKPGGTQPLKWKYSSPGSKTWSNEAYVDGTAYAPDITYESTVYYIIYKSKSAPGIQPVSINER